MPTRAEIEAAWKIRVTQKEHTDRNSLCGVHYKFDEKGRKYFDIPSWCKADAVVLGYHIGEEFNPHVNPLPDPVSAPEPIKADIGALLEAAPATEEPARTAAPRRKVASRGRKKITIRPKAVEAPATTVQE